LNGVALRIEMR